MSEKHESTAAETQESGSARRWVFDAFALLGPATLVIGLLYYFGYVGTRAFYSYFGVHVGVLDLAAERFLVRNAGTLFQPAAFSLVVVIGLFFGHRVIGKFLPRVSVTWARLVVLAVGIACAGALLTGLVGIYATPLGIPAPIWLVGAILLFEYTIVLAARFRVLPLWLVGGGSAFRRGLLAALVFVVVFWEVTVVAEERGQGDAELVEANVPFLPQAVVYSDEDLHLPGPGVTAVALTGQNSAYSFRYNGLRQLSYTNGRWFLLPVGWRRDNGATVIVLQDDPGHLRVDLAP